MKNRQLPNSFKMDPESDGTFEGYGAIFNTADLGLDVIDPTAFNVSLDKRKNDVLPILWQHDPSNPIGYWESVTVDETGLFCKGRILKDVSKGADAIALLKAMAIGGLSIGYRTVKSVQEGGGRIRRLLEVDLREISIVTFGMHPDAIVTAMKSEGCTIRQFEEILRDAGFSHNEAKALSANGFSGLEEHRRDGESKQTTGDDVIAALDILKEIENLQRNILS
jgi:HK97 family phage prohead protease